MRVFKRIKKQIENNVNSLRGTIYKIDCKVRESIFKRVEKTTRREVASKAEGMVFEQLLDSSFVIQNETFFKNRLDTRTSPK